MAGFPKGVGHEVLWSVREDHLADVHFGTRQYNFIRCQTNDLPGFARALQNRIEDTVGKGPLGKEWSDTRTTGDSGPPSLTRENAGDIFAPLSARCRPGFRVATQLIRKICTRC